jgi:hypothetical protein
MLATVCQRWQNKRTSFRPAGELFNPGRHEVVVLSESDARGFITEHHYSGSMPASRFRAGLMRKMPFGRDVLAGVAVFSVPMQAAVLSRHLKADVQTGAELGRFVLLDEVEGNGETYFLAAANRLLARETPIRAVVSYSDPIARVCEDGRILKPGHIGVIYQASGFRMVGRSSPRTLVLTGSGLVISDRALSKIRNQEQGHAYAYQQLLAAGAPERKFGEDPRSYVQRALQSGCFTRHRHPGNFVYTYAVGSPAEKRRIMSGFAPALPYPKSHHQQFDPVVIDTVRREPFAA